MHPIIELRNTSSLEKAIVNRLLQLDDAVPQAEMIKGLAMLTPSQPTLSRAVSRLVDKGIVARTGRARGSRFSLTPKARHFAMPPWQREPLPFDPSRIEGYMPNQSSWLSEAARKRMETASAGESHQLDASTYSRRIAERFVIDLSWASSRLEGNTYDFLDTEMLLRYGQEAKSRDRFEARMVLNHKNAINHLLENVGKGIPSLEDVNRMHAHMMYGLIEFEFLGQVRRRSVRITSTSYRPSNDSSEIARQQAIMLSFAAEIQDPFEAGFFLLASCSYLQAYVDGNKRMGRLLCNAPLLEAGKPPISFVDIDRDSYLLGLIAFYETAETELLAEAIAGTYEIAAPQYQAAMSSQQLPRGIELREGKRIANCIREIVKNGKSIAHAPGEVQRIFSDLKESEREEIMDIIVEQLGALMPIHATIFGLEDGEVEEWLRRKSAVP